MHNVFNKERDRERQTKKGREREKKYSRLTTTA